MMGLSVVLPEEEGGTWRWYTNQGVERARPPPKPNDEWYHQGSGEDEGTTTAPYRSHLFSPPYNNKLEWYTNQGDDAGRVRPPPKPNEGAMMDLGQRPSMWYHSTAHDWYRVPAPLSPTYEGRTYDGGTTTAVRHPYYVRNQYDGSSNRYDGNCHQYNGSYINDKNKPNDEGRRWYGDPIANWHHDTPPISTTTVSQPYYMCDQYDGSNNHLNGGASHNGCHYPTMERRGMSPPADTDSDPVEDLPTSCPYQPQYPYWSNNNHHHGIPGMTTTAVQPSKDHCTGGANHHDRHQPTIERRPCQPHLMEGRCMATTTYEPYYVSSPALATRTTYGPYYVSSSALTTTTYEPYYAALSSASAATTIITDNRDLQGLQYANQHEGTDHTSTASTSLPYDTTTRYIPKRYQTLVHGTMTNGCTSTCTSHIVYGEAAAATTTSGCTSTCTLQAATPMADDTIRDTAGYPAYAHQLHNSNGTTTAMAV